MGSVLVKLVRTLLHLITVVLLARLLGTSQYGIYAYTLTIATVITIPAQLGFSSLVIRETAKHKVASQWGVVKGIWAWSASVSSSISIGLALLCAILGWVYSDSYSTLELTTYAFALLLIPFLSLQKVTSAAIIGLGRVVLGQLPDFVVRPGVLLLLILVVSKWGERLTATSAMTYHAFGAGVALLVAFLLLKLVQPTELFDNQAPEYRKTKWMKSAWPLTFLASVQLLNNHIDVLMLGVFTSASDVGIYRVVVQGGTLVTFGLQAINVVVAPQFTSLYAKKDYRGLQRVVTQSSRVILVLAIPAALLFIFGGKYILMTIFGPDYVHGYIALVILSIGQLVNGVFGSVGFLLNMTGHEHRTAVGVAVACVVNIALNLVLIPIYGMYGAAMATVVSFCLWNYMLWYSVKTQLGINSIAFGRI